MSQYDDLDHSDLAGLLAEGVSQMGDDDQYQFEEVIKQKLDQVTDLKQLAKLQTYSDEQIINNDMDVLIGNDPEKAVDGQTADKDATNENEEESADDDDEDEDDFECDIEKYVPFEDKLEFAERLKTSSREIITQIIKLLTEIQPQGIDDYGNSRV